MGQSNRQTIENYFQAKESVFEAEIERLFERVESLRMVNTLRAIDPNDWSAWDAHRKRFIEPRMSPPPPPKRPAPPQGSGPRIQYEPCGWISQ